MEPEVQDEWIQNPASQLKGQSKGYSKPDGGYKISFDVEGRKVAQTFILKGRLIELLANARVVNPER